MTDPLRYQIDLDQLKCFGCNYSYSYEYQYKNQSSFRTFIMIQQVINPGFSIILPICQHCDATLSHTTSQMTCVPVITAHQCQLTIKGDQCQRLAKVSYSADGRQNWIWYCSCHANLSPLNHTHFIKGYEPTIQIDGIPSS